MRFLDSKNRNINYAENNLVKAYWAAQRMAGRVGTSLYAKAVVETTQLAPYPWPCYHTGPTFTSLLSTHQHTLHTDDELRGRRHCHPLRDSSSSFPTYEMDMAARAAASIAGFLCHCFIGLPAPFLKSVAAVSHG